MVDKWNEHLQRCAEGMYVLEEESKKVVWANRYILDGLGEACVGETCHRAFLGRDEMCHFCPKLQAGDDLYTWDFYDYRHERWMKVKHLLVCEEGVLYRVGNINMIDDVMRLNYETVREICALNATLVQNRSEVDSLTHEVVRDTLTGLYNRRRFQRDLEREYNQAPGLGVMFFDLNNLKEVNDKFRHTAGDELLRRVAKVLLLTSEAMGNTKCYRIGGDEFVLLRAESTMDEMDRCAAFFVQCMQAHNQGQAHACSVAIGRAFSRGLCDPEVLVSKADDEMYRCKRRMKQEALDARMNDEVSE